MIIRIIINKILRRHPYYIPFRKLKVGDLYIDKEGIIRGIKIGDNSIAVERLLYGVETPKGIETDAH